MNDLKIFKSQEFGQVRTVTINNEPYLVGNDVAIILGYAEPRSTVSKKVDEEDRGVAKIETPSGTQEMTVINESGLFSLILGSKLPSAKKFKRWVTSEVLPSIRKTGTYQKQLTTQEIMREQLTMIDNVSYRVDKLENTMVIDYGQQQTLKKLVNTVVVKWLGGMNTPAYKEIGKKVFSECNRDIQDRFNVNSRNNVPRLKYGEVCEYIKAWEPCTNTKMLIYECNAQYAFAGV